MILLEIKFKLIAVRLDAILDMPAEKTRDTTSMRSSLSVWLLEVEKPWERGYQGQGCQGRDWNCLQASSYARLF